MIKIAINNNSNSVYYAAFEWYISIVMPILGKSDKFQLEYLNLFDRYFIAAIKYIISENQASTFNLLISSLVDGVFFPHLQSGIWDYIHFLLEKDFEKYQQLDLEYNIEKKVNELARAENYLYSQKELFAWLSKFDELKKIIEPNIDNKEITDIHKIETQITDSLIDRFKYNNLLNIVYFIGAYCLFKKRYDFIKYLWEYKQPPDSATSWIGHDILPNTLNDVVNFYFHKDFLLDDKFRFWEGHHDSEKYTKQYFLLLLSRILQDVSLSEDGKYSLIEKANIRYANICSE